MCSGSKSSAGVCMKGDNKQEERVCKNSSDLLELTAVNDLAGFKRAIEEEGYSIDEPISWYGRRIGSKKLGFVERTPLMIAAMFGSKDVVSYILQTGCVDVNRACGSDGVTALHCVAASGCYRSHEIVKLLIDASADINCVDANGSRPCDVIAVFPSSKSKLRRMVEIMLKGEADQVIDEEPVVSVNKTEKKEYPIDPSLPDIKNGICSTDEFRMYSFKVKPCSRAYSHDWTECPFVHPGENARRRDPRKYHYSCVPCPEFRKGCCSKGDACEYAHGIFECWLHPAQYRTRLCKDETNCPRRVCFFAHKTEELRPLYASTGSAVPSPRSMTSIGAFPFDMPSLNPLALGSSSMSLSSIATPPMTPTSAASSPICGGGSIWQNQFTGITPPSLQLPGSRLRTSLNARDAGLENQRRMLQFDEFAALSSPRWNTSSMSNVKPTSLNDSFGYVEPAVLSQSPTGMQIRQNMNQQLRSTYPAGIASSPVKGSPLFGMDPPANSRSAAFAKRSQSFLERGAATRLSGLSSPAPSSPNQHSYWGSPGGGVDWGFQEPELNLTKSASFKLRSTANTNVSWVPPIDKDEQLGFVDSGGSETFPTWVDHMHHFLEQQQEVA